MAILLSEREIRLLKELKGAGDRGRLISGSAPRAGLMRLVKSVLHRETSGELGCRNVHNHRNGAARSKSRPD
jgi:hypothetical protein